jgi:hypothetical protein
MKPLFLAVAALAVALSASAANAQEPVRSVALSAAKKHPVTRRAPQEPAHIACTINGCQPTPPGCHPEMGYYPNGIPTGYDIVVCPWRGRPRG